MVASNTVELQLQEPRERSMCAKVGTALLNSAALSHAPMLVARLPLSIEKRDGEQIGELQ